MASQQPVTVTASHVSAAKARRNDPPLSVPAGSDDRPGQELATRHSSSGSTESDDDYPQLPWLEQVYGSAKADSDKKEVGYLDSKLIRRSQIQADFWVYMDKPNSEAKTSETTKLAFDLFDRYGRLLREHIQHPVNNSSGVWGTELDRGDLLLVENIRVEPAWRRSGLGRRLVEAVLAKTQAKTAGRFFALARPSWLISNGAQTHDKAKQQALVAERFWRSAGFRRVGTSSWFAYAPDAGHASHHLPPWQDHNPSTAPAPAPSPPPAAMLFHHIADEANTPDQTLATILQQTLPANPGHPLWTATDADGNTLLHSAARFTRPQAARYLLSRKPNLAHSRNARDHTPAQALTRRLDLARTRQQQHGNGNRYTIVSDTFRGFPPAAVDTLAALEGLNLNGGGISGYARARQQQLTFGCTCRCCAGGFLSPRTRYALRRAAQSLGSVSPEARARYGMFAVCLLAGDEQPPAVAVVVVPTVGNVGQCAGIAGGIPVPPVLLDLPVLMSSGRRVVRAARDADEWAGDGSLVALPECRARLAALRECRNDHEFAVVSALCGYGPL
ncbi:hypothetical protein B0T24DRAFT_233275 [Lasiosphaeria ovina]|uniref:N-acetyltransferase domain-containing protein n=1 Tax=Lasiosphaeria ovina TaxID=92902 RepID=A0AAE0KI63_9PEZI|nr:hypothetical protein B0T24DRAFT_233275 [Lasiosphaeria ovina]